MPEVQITNPLGSFGYDTADNTTYLDSFGNPWAYPQRYVYLRANDTILKYDAVALVAATAANPLSVEKLDVSDAMSVTAFIGVAQLAAVAGDMVKVVTAGFTLANWDSTDPVFGSAVGEGAADGQLGAVLVGALDSTIIEVSIFGVALDVETSADIAPIWLYGRY